MTPEKKIKAAVVKVLKKHNVYYFFPATGGYGRSGVPDIVCCIGGNFLGIECKTAFNKLTPLQERELGAIEAAGGMTLVAREDSSALVEAVLRLLMTDTN